MRTPRRPPFNALLLSCFLSLGFATSAQQDEPRAGAATGVNHLRFDKLLRKHVHGDAVDYAGLREDVGELEAYLRELAEATVEGVSRAEKLALYINAYNAFTLRLIARNYPDIESIRDIDKPWKRREWIVAGEKYSLDQIEHGILRRQLKEPRIHFAVNCASVSCPPLRPHAYRPDRIEEQLDQATRDFLRSANVRVETEEGRRGKTQVTLSVSRIFKWFRGDFEPSIPEFVAKYADPRTATTIRANLKRVTVEFQEYDWKLNDYIR